MSKMRHEKWDEQQWNHNFSMLKNLSRTKREARKFCILSKEFHSILYIFRSFIIEQLIIHFRLTLADDDDDDNVDNQELIEYLWTFSCLLDRDSRGMRLESSWTSWTEIMGNYYNYQKITITFSIFDRLYVCEMKRTLDFAESKTSRRCERNKFRMKFRLGMDKL